jgi:hypothetical protein
VPAGSPAAGSATPVLVPAPPGWGAPAVAPATPPVARPPVVIPPIPPVIAPHPGPYRNQQRSLSEMANEQLRRNRKDPLAQGMEGAGVDDCLHAPEGTPAVGGLLAAPGLVARALSGRCAK